MNFLKYERGSLTYKRVAKLFAVWIALLILIGGVQILRTVYARYELRESRKYVEELNAEKDRRMALAQTAGLHRARLTAEKDLHTVFLYPPHWSEVLKTLAQNVPAQLRLTSLTTSEENNGAMILEIKGIGTSVRTVTELIMKLERAKGFKRVRLNGTTWNQGRGDFEFEMHANINPTEQ
jgi:Tfp pilus assembly protein PilN